MSHRIRWYPDKLSPPLERLTPSEWTRVLLPYTAFYLRGKACLDHDGTYAAFVSNGAGWHTRLVGGTKAEAKRAVVQWMRERIEEDLRREVTERLNGCYFPPRPVHKKKHLKQTWTSSTGRFSVSQPNLQQLPTKTRNP